MKILLLLGWYFPNSVGGTETYVRMLANDLKALGCEVYIAAPTASSQEAFYTFEGIEVYRYPVGSSPTSAEVRGEAPPVEHSKFIAWLQKLQPDIVHQHTYSRGCGYFHAQAVTQLGIPLIFTVHVPGVTCRRGTLMRWGTTPCDGEFYAARCTACSLHQRGLPQVIATGISQLPLALVSPFSSVESSFATALGMKSIITRSHARVQAVFTMASYVVAVADWLAAVLLSNGVTPDKLFLSRHGISHGLISQANSVRKEKDSVRIAYVGRFDPIKGVHVLIDAMKKLPVSPKRELFLYGRINNSDEAVYVERLKAAANGRPDIVFDGEVTADNRSAVMSQIDVLAVPSIGFETGPLVLLEAFAAGIPVIGSDLGGIAENVTHKMNGLLVAPGDVDGWATAIQSVTDNPHELYRLREHIPAVRTSRDTADEMLRLYQAAASGDKP